MVAPPEQTGQNSVLHPALCNEASSQCNISKPVLVQCDAYRDDKCTVLSNESWVPLVSLGTGDEECLSGKHHGLGSIVQGSSRNTKSDHELQTYDV